MELPTQVKSPLFGKIRQLYLLCPCTLRFLARQARGTTDSSGKQSEGLSKVEADGARYIPFLGKTKLVANPYVERVRGSALGNDINNNIYPWGSNEGQQMNRLIAS